MDKEMIAPHCNKKKIKTASTQKSSKSDQGDATAITEAEPYWFIWSK